MSQTNKNAMNRTDKNMKDRSQNSNKNQTKPGSNQKAKNGQQKEGFNYYLLPLLFILSVLPLIMKEIFFDSKLQQFVWAEKKDTAYDLFLYYKHWVLVAIALIMIVILVYYGWTHRYKDNFRLCLCFIPLGIYALMALLSAVFSDYAYFSFHGITDQFESVFALLGYCILVFYAFQFIKTENDIRLLIRFLLISVLVLTALGITQFIGKDFFASEFGTRLVTGGKYGKGALSFNFGPRRVYLTLYNPNYVGVYAALVAPIFLVLLLFSKRLVSALWNLAALIGIMVCVMGAQSLAGIISIVAALIGIAIVMWRHLLKRIYITMPVILIIIITMVIINFQTDNYMLNRLKGFLSIQKADAPDITSMTAGPEKVSITYKGNEINFSFITDEANTVFFHIVTDSSGTNLPYVLDETDGFYDIQDDRFAGISFSQAIFQDTVGIDVRIDGKEWVFSNQVGDGSYYLLNRFQKWDKLYQHKDNVLTGYETIASLRGYIWSRTLPLLKNYTVLGSGPDTFTMAFPQNDYLGFYNHGYESLFITKPHSLYLQIAVQTGLVSLLAFLLFYGFYFINSAKLYLRGRFNSYYAQVGVAIWIGTFAYMIAGLTNDSSITTAPVFWCLMGIGLVANEKAKPLIMEESARSREEKQHSKDTEQAATGAKN